VDLNTMRFGEGAVINSPRNIKVMAERIYAAGVKPELEVFDAGDIVLARDLIADGTLQQPALFQIVTGTKCKTGFASTVLAHKNSFQRRRNVRCLRELFAIQFGSINFLQVPARAATNGGIWWNWPKLGRAVRIIGPSSTLRSPR
jgi:hypothetical protein